MAASKLMAHLRNEQAKQEESAGYRRGYWLVRESDKSRFFISITSIPSALDRVCDKVLSDKMGFEYWIDYCLGLDVTGEPAWLNIDQSDRF